MTIDVPKASFRVSRGFAVIEQGDRVIKFPVEQAHKFSDNLDLAVFLNQDLDWDEYQQRKADAIRGAA